MQTLRELQLGFAQAVHDAPSAERFAARVRGRGLAGSRRIQIYRNNLRATLSGALAAVYPVLQRLLGTACFDALARAYVCSVASTSGDIHQYGDAFGEFVAGRAELAPYPYLPDVARLEWAYHAVFHCERAPGLDVLALRGVAPADYPRLRFRLQPALRLLASPWPVLRIWQVNQPGWTGDQSVSLDAGGVELLVMRDADGVLLKPLAAGEHRLLQELDQGATLAEAYEAAVRREPGFDLAGALPWHVAHAVLVACTCHASPAKGDALLSTNGG